MSENDSYPFWLFKLNSFKWRSYGWTPSTLFSLDIHAQIATGDLALILLDDRLIVARWFPNVAGESWLLEPGLAYQISRFSVVVVIGALNPLKPYTL